MLDHEWKSFDNDFHLPIKATLKVEDETDNLDDHRTTDQKIDHLANNLIPGII